MYTLYLFSLVDLLLAIYAGILYSQQSGIWDKSNAPATRRYRMNSNKSLIIF